MSFHSKDSIARGEGTWICRFYAFYRRKQSPVEADVVAFFGFGKLVSISKKMKIYFNFFLKLGYGQKEY